MAYESLKTLTGLRAALIEGEEDGGEWDSEAYTMAIGTIDATILELATLRADKAELEQKLAELLRLIS